MVETSREEKLRIFAEEIYGAAEIGMWCFDEGQRLFNATIPYQEEMLGLLKKSGCLDYVYDRDKGFDRPTYLSDANGLLWIAEHFYEGTRPAMAIVMGPFLLSGSSSRMLESYVKNMELSIASRKRLEEGIRRIPRLLMSMLNQYSIMLHYALTDEIISPRNILFQNPKKEQVPWPEEDMLQGEVDSEAVVKGEKVLLNAIRDGNLNYKQILDDEGNFGGGYVSRTGDGLRDAKNTVIVFCALAVRAAIEGGLPVKAAKEIEMRFIGDIEKCHTVTQLSNLNQEMLEECVHRVYRCRNNEQDSSVIQECCDYIKANVLKPLTVEQIAKEMGYTAYYFTRKFYNEAGIRIYDYIKEARIEYAKIVLATTKNSIQEISDSLHFGTRYYFTKVFHDIVGETPAAYREHANKSKN